MSTNLNTVSAKRTLSKNIEEVTKKLDQQRWLKTPEGEHYLLQLERKKRIAEIKKEMKIGQLVWRTVVIENTDSFGNDQTGDLCCRIVALYDEEILSDVVEVEMLFVKIGEVKFDEYVGAWGFRNKKGDKTVEMILGLEKHIAKTTGNIWWKVKQY